MKTNPLKNPSFPRRSDSGFSLVELLVVCALLAIVAAIAIEMTGSTSKNVAATKLTSDVQKLNAIISTYVEEGGSLAGLTTPQAVIDKLKTTLSAADATRNVGVMTGRGVDVRLSAQMQSATDASTSAPRAVWDSVNQKFTVSTAAGTQGVSGFVLDDTLAAKSYGTETRTATNERYNGTANGWVWAPGNNTTLASIGSVEQAQTDVGNTFDPTGSISTGTVAASGPVTLPPPIMSIPGGVYYTATFPGQISLSSNGAPSGSSTLQYNINGGPWMVYSAPLTITSGMTVTARSVSTNPSLYANSATATASYYTLVNSFTGSVSAGWAPSSGSGRALVSTVSNSNPNSVVETDGTPAPGYTGPNVFTFNTPGSFAGIAPNAQFAIGQLVYHNGTIYSGTGSTSLDLKLNITLTNPQVATTTVDIPLSLDNTANSGNGNNALSADTATLASPVTNYSIVINGVTYTLRVFFGNIDVTQGYVSGNTLGVWEGATGTVNILAMFATN
jgi:prepilin-type N-terminal cleavage/methylation domain-containing protein